MSLWFLIRGGGEVASGIAHKLHRSHLRVCLTEVANPLAVSRGTAFSEAVFEGVKAIMGVTAELVPASLEEINVAWQRDNIPVIIDTPLGKIDDEHRDNITNDLPKFLKGTQLILLMTPTEYDAVVKKNLNKFVVKGNSYLIKENNANDESRVMKNG